jgi:hypothetical protein
VVESIDSAAIESSVLLPDCKHDGPLLFLSRTQLLAACGDIHSGDYPERSYGVFHVDLPSQVVRPYGSAFSWVQAWVWRFDHRKPRPWDAAEHDSAFEGPPALDSVSKDSNRRWLWFDPQAKVQKPLFKEKQYEAGLRNRY